MTFFLSCHIYFLHILFGLLFPFSLWTLISHFNSFSTKLFSIPIYFFQFWFRLLFSLFNLDFYFPFHFFFFSFFLLFYHIAVWFWISSKILISFFCENQAVQNTYFNEFLSWNFVLGSFFALCRTGATRSLFCRGSVLR